VTEALAIDGGTPVRDRMLPYGHQVIDDDDVCAVVRALKSDWLTTGPAVESFERAFADLVDAAHAVAVSNGTAALHAAVFAAGIKPGDEVITTPMTFASTANAVRFQGGTVVFADVRHDSLNIDPASVCKQLTDKTRAIIVVDYAGQPSDLDDIRDIASDRDIVVIEDAAHALGAVYRGRPIGSIAPLTTFSFHPVKQITTCEGGMITTNDATLADLLRRFRNHGITTDARQREQVGSWFYEMTDLGNNYRISDIHCALGRSQLAKLDRWLDRRRKISAKYTAAFAEMPELDVPAVEADRQSAWHLYMIRLNLDRLRVGRDWVFRALRAENIGVNVHYIPVPWHPYYQSLGYQKGQWPVAEQAYERLITLPLWAGMTDEDVAAVTRAMEKVVKSYRV
jgi:perosamine synthetase